MSDAIQLPPDGLINMRMVVPMQVRPNGGITIDVFPSPAVAQQSPLPFHEHKRLKIGTAPLALVGEGMPEQPLVRGD